MPIELKLRVQSRHNTPVTYMDRQIQAEDLEKAIAQLTVFAAQPFQTMEEKVNPATLARETVVTLISSPLRYSLLNAEDDAVIHTLDVR